MLLMRICFQHIVERFQTQNQTHLRNSIAAKSELSLASLWIMEPLVITRETFHIRSNTQRTRKIAAGGVKTIPSS